MLLVLLIVLLFSSVAGLLVSSLHEDASKALLYAIGFVVAWLLLIPIGDWIQIGLLSQPIWHRASDAAILSATVRPANAAHKVVSMNTDLLANRPWDLAGAITRI